MWLWWLGILCDGHPFTSDPGIILVTSPEFSRKIAQQKRHCRAKPTHTTHRGIGERNRVLHREQTFSTENRIHVIRKLVPGLRTASDKASVASQCSLLPRRTIRSTGKGAIARRFKPALHAVSPH